MMRPNQLVTSLTLAAAACAALGTATPVARADVIIGDWENDTDGWIDWGNSQQPIIPGVEGKFSYATDVGVTHGTHSLKLTRAGWDQNLSIKLQDAGHRADFFANKKFMIDVTLPETTLAGWNQIYEFVVNSPAGWQGQMGNPVQGTEKGWGEGGGPAQTYTLTWDYSALVDGNPDNGEIAPNADWVEFIFATNSGPDHGVFYFDNARLVSDAPPAVPGDADGDGDVDLDDQGIWASNFTGSLDPGTGTGTFGQGDFDGDKDVDLDDQGIWASNFTGSLAPSALAVVPEPATLSSILYPLSSLLLYRRRRTT